MINKIDGIYVIHAPKGYELHEKRVVKLFKELKLKFDFVGDAEPAQIDDLLDERFVKSKSRGNVLCTISHLLAYQKVLQNGNKLALIFEDDPFFLGDFHKSLNKLEPEILKLDPGFIVSLENTTLKYPSFWQTKRNKFIYRAKMGRAAAAYIIDSTAAESMLMHLKQQKCNQVIDWWHNDLIDKKIIKMYWAHPPFVEQGSHNGEQSAPKSSQQKLLSRVISWKIQKFYKYCCYRIFNQDRIIKE